MSRLLLEGVPCCLRTVLARERWDSRIKAKTPGSCTQPIFLCQTLCWSRPGAPLPLALERPGARRGSSGGSPRRDQHDAQSGHLVPEVARGDLAGRPSEALDLELGAQEAEVRRRGRVQGYHSRLGAMHDSRKPAALFTAILP